MAQDSGTETFGTLNPVSGELEYQKATEVFHADYFGQMYRVRSEQVDLLVTPNHRMWVQRHDTQAARRGEQQFAIEFPNDISISGLATRSVHDGWGTRQSGIYSWDLPDLAA